MSIYLLFITGFVNNMGVLNREKDTRQSWVNQANYLVSEGKMDIGTFQKIMNNVSSYPLVQQELYENLNNDKPSVDILDENDG